jgi:hypothetical protein
MKKASRLLLFGLACIAGASLLIFTSAEKVSGLSDEVVFNGGARCGCGFESFYFIRGTTLYDICPGHEQHRKVGEFEPFGDLERIKIISKKDGKTYYPYLFDRNKIDLKLGGIKDDDYYTLQREHNPWKILLPYYFK